MEVLRAKGLPVGRGRGIVEIGDLGSIAEE